VNYRFLYLCPQEDLRKAILASIEDFDPDNPWIVDASGRHTNVAALLDWPSDDSSDDESVPSKNKSINYKNNLNLFLIYYRFDKAVYIKDNSCIKDLT